MEDTAPKCARCPYSYSDRFCNTVDGKFLPSCPTEKQRELLSKSLKEYEKPKFLSLPDKHPFKKPKGMRK